MKKHNFAPLILVAASGILGVLLVIGICTSLLPGMWNNFTQVGEEVVDRFGEITDKFVGKFLIHEGESVEEAKERLASEQAAREEAARAEAEEREAALREIVEANSSNIAQASIDASLNRAKNSVEASKNAGKRP